jgi:peptide/nickel transport system substrate-binding protein
LAPRIGTGPFTFNNITLEEDSGQVRLTRFDRYYLGSPLLDEVVIKSYQDHESMINAFNEGTITGIAGLRIQDLESLKPKSDFTLHAPSLFNNIGIFFNNNQDPLKNVKMRQALTYATDNSQVASMLGYKYPSSSSPLLRSQLGYSDKYQQLSYDKTKAQKLLDELGWKVGPDGIRIKDGAALEMQLLAQNSDEYPAVAEEIQRQWHEVGIVLKLEFVSPTDLQQNHVVPHNYQLLLIGINQGVDPDVFAYWHSSEAGIGGFNLSEYKNSVADLALESGRTRQDPKLRTAKYETFLQQWRKDAPAVMLYRPSYFYAQLEVVTGFENKHIDDPVDRFSDIAFWTINTKEVNKSY